MGAVGLRVRRGRLAHSLTAAAETIDPILRRGPRGHRRTAVHLLTDRVARGAFERDTGWTLKPEGACQGDVCVPLDDSSVSDDRVHVESIAERLGMPIVRHSDALAALGPATFGGNALATATAPALVLPDLDGKPFDLSSLRGQKVVMVAWSPY